jgi:putative SOS response-associated peptidase YedK
MCGRYSLAPNEFSQIRLEFQVEIPFELEPRYNIAPTWSPGHEPPILTQDATGARRLDLARWWMIPAAWNKALAALPTAFNARAEELDSRPFWSRSFASRRCLVPATGWREFRGPAGQREAFQFHHEHGLFAFAGLWDSWTSPEGEAVRSFAIVTVAASELVAPIHDRMPLRVAPEFYSAWLDPELEGTAALETVRSRGELPLEVYAADTRGNDVRVEGPAAIAPARVRQLRLFD